LREKFSYKLYEFWKLVLRKLIAISEDGRLKKGQYN